MANILKNFGQMMIIEAQETIAQLFAARAAKAINGGYRDFDDDEDIVRITIRRDRRIERSLKLQAGISLQKDDRLIALFVETYGYSQN